jgi:hypothetical protein
MVDADLIGELYSLWVPPETLALFLYLCKAWPDSEKDFPSGKWGSIQALELRLERHIAAAHDKAYEKAAAEAARHFAELEAENQLLREALAGIEEDSSDE